MSIELISFFAALLVLITLVFIRSLFEAEKVDLYVRIQRGNVKAAAEGRNGLRISGSQFGRIYGKYMDRPFGYQFERLAVLMGLDLQHLQERISLAGKEDRISAIEIVALKVLAIIFLMVAGIPIFVSGDMIYMILTFVAFVTMYFLPESKIRSAIKDREQIILEELPAFIEQVYLCIEAGANLKPALETVSGRIGGELGKAFREALIMEVYSGSWENELISMCERMHVEALEDFIVDVLNANDKGISITETLRNEVRHINVINRSRIREKTEQLNSSMVIPIMVFFVLPSMAIIMVPILLEMVVALS